MQRAYTTKNGDKASPEANPKAGPFVRKLCEGATAATPCE